MSNAANINKKGSSKSAGNEFALIVILVAFLIMHIRPISSFYMVRLIAPSVLFYILISSSVWIFRREGLKKFFNLPIAIYFLFLIYSYILIYFSPSSFESKEVFAQFLIGFIVFLIAYLMFNKSQYVIYIFVFYIVLASLLSIFGIFQYHYYFNYLLSKYEGMESGENDFVGGIIYALRHKRIGSTLGAANIFAGFLCITFPFFIYALISAKKLIVRVIVSLLMIIFLYAFFLTSSRGGLLTLIFALVTTAFLFALQDKKMMKKVLIIFVALVVLMIVILLIANIFWQEDKQQDKGIQSASFFDRLLSSSTIRDRITYLKVGIQLFLKNPVFGNGNGSYAILCTQLLPTISGSKFAHNFLIQLLCETGLIGILLFVSFIDLLIMYIYKYGFKSSNNENKNSTIQIALLASILTFLFNGLLEYSFYFEELFLDWMLLCGVALGLVTQNKAIKSETENKTSKHKSRIKEVIVLISFLTALLWGLIYTVCLPSLSNLYEERGRAFYESNNNKYAQIMLKQSTSFCKDNYKAYIGLSRIYTSYLPEWNPTLSIYYLKEAIKYNPHQAFLHNDLGNLYLDLGMFDEAYKEFQIALKYFPANPKYREELNKVKNRLQAN